jgi:hypothetical protein
VDVWCQDKEAMSWRVMDMTALDFPDGSFDVVIDKAAMDALLTDEGSVWEPNAEVCSKISSVCCLRVVFHHTYTHIMPISCEVVLYVLRRITSGSLSASITAS